jgi:hypothetical protein
MMASGDGAVSGLDILPTKGNEREALAGNHLNCTTLNQATFMGCDIRSSAQLQDILLQAKKRFNV